MKKREHLFYFPNFEEAEKTKIILEHYQTKFICKWGRLLHKLHWRRKYRCTYHAIPFFL